MREPLRQNWNKFAMQCKRRLEKEKEYADPDRLYALQLANWVVQNHQLEGPWAAYQPDLDLQVGMMLGWKPENALKLLKPFPEVKKKDSALDVGMRLLENIHANVSPGLP